MGEFQALGAKISQTQNSSHRLHCVRFTATAARGCWEPVEKGEAPGGGKSLCLNLGQLVTPVCPFGENTSSYTPGIGAFSKTV